MDTGHNPAQEDAQSLLQTRQVFDIDSFGWLNENDVDPDFVGYAMWVINSPYDHDMGAWQRNRPPDQSPTKQQRKLMECGHDFFGLMKTARHFIGEALVHQPAVPPLRVDGTPFDFSEFAALAALVAASDRLRDFLVIGVLGRKTGDLQQLDNAYALLKSIGLDRDLQSLADSVIPSLRKARNAAVHGLATLPAQVQRMLLRLDRDAFETGRWRRADPVALDHGKVIRRGRTAEADEIAAVEARAARLCEWYIGLVDIGGRTFRAEYEWRNKRDAALP